MKLFKKVAATALAAVLALSMLTACSGGGGGAVSAGDLTAQNFGGSYTIEFMDVDDIENRHYITTDGTSIYDDWYGDATLCIPTEPKVYVVDFTAKEYHETTYGPEDYDPFLPRAATMRGGTFRYDSKTYQTETIEKMYETGKLTFTYCYENGSPVYLIEDYDATDDERDYYTMYRVVMFSRTADMDKLNLSNYTLEI